MLFARTKIYLRLSNPQLLVSGLHADSTWKLMFRQTVPFYLHPATRWLSVNPNKPSNPNYSILNTLERCRDARGQFTFKIVWPRRKGKNYNIWQQSTNPVTQKIPVSGYKAIDVNFKTQRWGGLESSYLHSKDYKDNPPALLDGSINHRTSSIIKCVFKPPRSRFVIASKCYHSPAYWYYAVGSIAPWSGGIPGANSAESQVELYAKCSAGMPTHFYPSQSAGGQPQP